MTILMSFFHSPITQWVDVIRQNEWSNDSLSHDIMTVILLYKAIMILKLSKSPEEIKIPPVR